MSFDLVLGVLLGTFGFLAVLYMIFSDAPKTIVCIVALGLLGTIKGCSCLCGPKIVTRHQICKIESTSGCTQWEIIERTE